MRNTVNLTEAVVPLESFIALDENLSVGREMLRSDLAVPYGAMNTAPRLARGQGPLGESFVCNAESSVCGSDVV